MMKNNQILGTLGTMAVIGCIVGPPAYYIKVLFEERAKRKKIDEWTLMNLNEIANSRNRITEKLLDPKVPLVKALRYWQEEEQWLEFMRNQPKY
jgi:hypothetical protein